MKKFLLSLVFACSIASTFSQWTRVAQLPPTFIATIYHRGDTLYAGGTNIIYTSRDNGQTWDSTSKIPQLFLVTSIIVYKNELYAAAPRRHVYKSPDGGVTWQKMLPDNDTLDVSDFCEFRGDLYASTFSNATYKLNPLTRNSWVPFNSGTSSLSIVSTALAHTSNTLVAGTLNNGLYDYLPPNSTTWEERFLLPDVSVTEGAFHIITAHDSLFWPGRTGNFYMSTDGGLSWNTFANRLPSGNTSVVNAKQALLASRYFFDGVSLTTAFNYLKKDALQQPFVNFSTVTDHFTWKIDIVGNKIWDASDHGLFFMPLSDLPGITAADDSLAPVVLATKFTSFNVTCADDNALITWKTAQEKKGSHFNIEKSNDGNHWTIIGDLRTEANGDSQKMYSFKDLLPGQNSYYRVAEIDRDGQAAYSNILRSPCNNRYAFSLWPNPAHNTVLIRMESATESQGIIKLFDHKGSLVSLKIITVLKGGNQINIDISLLSAGIYSLTLTLGNGLTKKAVRVIKE